MNQLLENKNALVIFIKAPRLGNVKTRLQPHLTLKQSLELYKAMGKDLVSQFEHPNDFDFLIYFWPKDAEQEIKEWLSTDLIMKPQQGEDLGEKLIYTFSELLSEGYEKVCIIGSDLPTLSQKKIQNAFNKLDSNDIVLGPTFDGGYYLVALKNNQPQLFKDIDWSTDRVLQQTLKKAEKNKLSVSLLDEKRDIDSFEDLADFWVRINNEDIYQIKNNLINTWNFIKNIFPDDDL